MGIGKELGGRLAPKVTRVAPELTAGFVHQALDRAIRGVPKLPGAATMADTLLAGNDGDVERAIHDVIEKHVRYAGAEGFVTNLGGLVTMAVTVPANITGLALIQCRMVAAIAHLRGYDLGDARTRTAILACLLREEMLLGLIKAKKMPGTPMALATAPVADPDLSRVMANEVAAELIAKVAGKKVVTTVGRRVPVVGGIVGAGTDAFSTWRVGRYVDRELLPRNRR
jgi:uncharacterized protein (DUF697 family)